MCANVNRKGRNKLSLKYPATWWKNMWREALPSGNGKIGASVYGAIKDETVLINHGDLWRIGRKDSVPDVSHTLEETRDLMLKGAYQDASWNLTNALKEKEYKTSLSSRLPLGALNLSMPCDKAFRNYERILDMETGEVIVKWVDDETAYQRNLFVSRADNLIAYEINSDAGGVSGTLQLSLQKSDKGKISQLFPSLNESMEVRTEPSYMFYAAQNNDGTDFGAVLRIVPTGGKVNTKEGNIQFKDTKKTLILLKVFVKGEREEEWQRLKHELAKIDRTYEQLLSRHVELHRPLFQTASIDLTEDDDQQSNEELLLEAYSGEAPTSLIEKMWAYGRYLFISGTGKQSQPFGLYGLWYGDYRVMWGHNMANENIQMMYWHTTVGGFVDHIPALFEYYDSMMDDFRNNAKNLYGCRGIFIPAGTTPGIGVPNQIVPVIMNWTGAAAWLAKHFYDYYVFTGDETFLKEKALPFMNEVALFYEDFLVLGGNGYYQYYPSVSPENTPENFMPKDQASLAHPMPTTINATVDFAIMKELFSHLIEGSQIVAENPDKIKKWKGVLNRIPSYQINDDGAIREWMHPDFDDRYNHRHLSHIYPIFPGQEFTQEEQPKLFKAFETAVQKRLIGAQTGWSLAHMAAIYARLGNGDKALECLDILARSCLSNNFYTLHNDWRDMGICMNTSNAPVQMDANLGWINAVQEMLIYVSSSIVKLLPAVPSKWRQGSVSDLRITTGKVSFSWDMEKKKFLGTILAERETKVTIKLPDYVEEYQLVGKGVSVKISSFDENYYDVQLNPGQKLTIHS